MIQAYQAVVTDQLPDRGGVLVRFLDGFQMPGGAAEDFGWVRVLQPQAHPAGAARVCLPEPGETGIVLVLPKGMHVWLGSMHWQNSNRIDGESGFFLDRLPNGVQTQARLDGAAWQWEHPSGLRVTVTKDGVAMPAPARHGDGAEVSPGEVGVEVAHPKGPTLRIKPDGAMEVATMGGGLLQVDADGNLDASGFASVTFQAGSKRFAMEGFFDWVKDTLVTWTKAHTHTSASSGSPTSPPIQAGSLAAPTQAACLSPTTFKGPQ